MMSKLTVLDKPDKIRAIDKGSMLELCERTPDFCRDAIKRAKKVRIQDKLPRNVVVVGMGGSAIGGEILKDWLLDRASIPIEVCRDYVLPAYVDENSLVIVVSYSGETEETLSAFLDAVKRDCMVVAVSSGGHLQTFSQKLKISHIVIPTGFPPRAAVAYTFFPLVILMEKLHIVGGINEEVEETIRVLQKLSEANRLDVPLEKNEAKKLAIRIEGTVPIVYGFRQYNSVTRRLKCQFNENSKVPSKFDAFSELNHNEVVGWEAPDVSPKVSKILEIKAVGKYKLTKMLSAMYIGDFASIYLAVLRGVNPTLTKTIAHLKREMKKKLDMMAMFEEEIRKIV